MVEPIAYLRKLVIYGEHWPVFGSGFWSKVSIARLCIVVFLSSMVVELLNSTVVELLGYWVIELLGC